MAAKCGACHGSSASAAGLDLSSYEGTMKGGEDGAVIVAGDSTGSILVQVQQGAHFAKFSAEELEIIIQWIEAGAPEN